MAIVGDILLSAMVALLLSTGWAAMAVLARMSDATFLPMGVRFLVASGVIFLLSSAAFQRVPRISMRLFHAAVTVAGLSYILSPLLVFYGLRIVPSGLGALIYVSMPLWYLLVIYKEGKHTLYHHAIVLAGIGLFAFGCWEAASMRGNPWLGIGACIAGIGSFILGLWVSKRLFWLHSSMDLNFWAMAFAALGHILLAGVTVEFQLPSQWPKAYWAVLLYLGFVVTGLGVFLYRIRTEAANSITLTALVPVGAIGLGYLMWQETPLNMFTLAGAALVIGDLAFNAVFADPGRWMCLHISNDKRQGDRLVCHLQSEVELETGEKHSIQVVNIALGGLGFRSSVELEKGQKVTVSMPISHQVSKLLLECEVTHIEKEHSKQYPFRCGLSFSNLPDSRRQSLIEFIARLTKAEDA